MVRFCDITIPFGLVFIISDSDRKGMDWKFINENSPVNYTPGNCSLTLYLAKKELPWKEKNIRFNYIIANEVDHIFIWKFRFNHINGVLRGSGHDKKAQKKWPKIFERWPWIDQPFGHQNNVLFRSFNAISIYIVSKNPPVTKMTRIIYIEESKK